MKKLPEYWQKFIQISEKLTDGKEKLEKKAKEWVKDYKNNGYIKIKPLDILKIDNYQFALFYSKLLQSKKGRLNSPVEKEENANWMCNSDFCFLNVRAIGKQHKVTGNFIDAIKILVLIRANSIHLAPFFDCVFGNVYAVDTILKITDYVVDQDFKKEGLTAEEQLKLFIDSVHILDKTVGFDLEPHTSQFSRVVLDNPEIFRWIELSKDRKTLANDIDNDEMLSESNQKEIHLKVKDIIDKHLKKNKIDKLETEILDNQQIKKIQNKIIEDLISNGLWTIPNHTWGGIGLPRYKQYNEEYNYPEFEYLDRDGNDQSSEAFGMLTPIKLGTDLNCNTLPSVNNPSRPWEQGVEYFSNIFPKIQKEYNFDFVRLDYVDHVFDSVLNGTEDIPLSDRPTPYVLKRVINKIKSEKKYIGAMAERMAYDIEDYSSIGFDLILGADMLRDIDINFIKDMIDFNQRITDFNSKNSKMSSILFAIDSHDTGHPGIDANPTDEGIDGMLMRYFLSRFLSCGIGRRPKYEVIGNQDLTTGLYEANNTPISLQWVGNDDFFDIYNNLEDIYNKFKNTIDNSYLRESHINDKYALWYLDRGDGFKSRLLCICYPKNKENTEERDLSIYPFYEYGFDCARVEEIDIKKNKITFVPIGPEGNITIKRLKPGEVKLFWIRENNTELPE